MGVGQAAGTGASNLSHIQTLSAVIALACDREKERTGLDILARCIRL